MSHERLSSAADSTPEVPMRTWLSRIALLALVVVPRAAYSGEEKVPLGEVPKAGLEAVKAMFPQAELIGAEKETEDGKTVYEVALKHKGRKIDVILAADGTIQLVEKQIDAKDLPKRVSQALRAKYPQATYKIIEEVSQVKDGKPKLDFYEALLITSDQRTLEVQIAPDGKVKREEKKQAEND
jgi:hypothetical protein